MTQYKKNYVTKSIDMYVDIKNISNVIMQQ